MSDEVMILLNSIQNAEKARLRALADKTVKRHVFFFNDEDNGGESLSLTTNMIANGDPGEFFYNQELSLQSYCNSASFHLYGACITPDALRRLADELEAAENEARAIINGTA